MLENELFVGAVRDGHELRRACRPLRANTRGQDVIPTPLPASLSRPVGSAMDRVVPVSARHGGGLTVEKSRDLPIIGARSAISQADKLVDERPALRRVPPGIRVIRGGELPLRGQDTTLSGDKQRCLFADSPALFALEPASFPLRYGPTPNANRRFAGRAIASLPFPARNSHCGTKI